MKAKDWYAKMVSCTTDEELTKTIGNCLEALIIDARKLIKTRRATSDKAVAACINEVNNRWCAICSLHEKSSYEKSHPLHDTKLLKDGFKAAFVHENPKMGWYFDLKQHRQYVSAEQSKQVEKTIMAPAYKLFKVTPFEEITMDNINTEILENLYLIGRFHSDPGVSMTLLMPLIHRARLLRHWSATGIINQEEAIEMQKDPYEFFEKNNIPI